MEAQFQKGDDGVIDVHLGAAWSGFSEALQDAVTTHAPRGSDGVNPSTCWIDRTVAALSSARDGEVVASGNASDLVVEADEVVARSQYDTCDDERLPRSDLLDVLAQWRAEVVRVLSSAERR